MENKKVEILKIVIKVGEKEATLSLDEAKQLRDVLDNLLGNKNSITYIPYSIPYINPNPYYPYWNITTCSSGNAVTYNITNDTNGVN